MSPGARGSRPRCGLAAALFAASVVAGVETPRADPAVVPGAPPRRAESRPALQTLLEDRYPMVRAVLIRRGDCPVFAFYKAGVEADTRLPLHSITKSVLSALVGDAIGRGSLGFGQTLGELLPESLGPTVDPRVRTMTIRHLLTMTAGFDAEAKPPAVAAAPEAWTWALRRPVLSRPGQAFRYDNQNANLLSVILSRRIGQSAERLAQDTMFGPLEIRNYAWLADADGHSMGAYGLWLTAADMAKIGALFLRHGRWNGRQVVPEPYVLSATRPQNAGGTPFRAGYGYLWWVKRTKTGRDAFFAAGSDGQLIYVVPKLDLVVVLASESAPPTGSVGFLDDVILPVAAAMPACRAVTRSFGTGQPPLGVGHR